MTWQPFCESLTYMRPRLSDESQGYPHIRRPLVGVEINFGLTATETAQLRRHGGQLRRILGAGEWHLSDRIDMLTVRHPLRQNRYGARTTARIATLSLATVNKVLAAL